MRRWLIAGLCLVMTWALPVQAELPLRIAVSGEFANAAEAAARLYGADTVAITSGSSGVLATQIAHGAPFDLFISSDEGRVRQLLADGHLAAGSDVVLARDGLVLWAPDYPSITLDRLGDVPRLVIANPAQSAYGVAAQQVLEKLKLWRHLGTRLVRVEQGALAYEHVAKGSAPAGLVPRSAVAAAGRLGEVKAIPDGDYAPVAIRAAVVTAGNRDKAQRFIRFLQNSGKTVLTNAGFLVQ